MKTIPQSTTNIDTVMTIQDLDPTIKEVAEVYGFSVSFCDVLERVIIKSDQANFRYDEFYWDSSETKESFFNELKFYFIEKGKKTINRW